MSTAEHRSGASGLTARCAVITCSDSRTKETDTSGAFIVDSIRAAGHSLEGYRVIPDDAQTVSEEIGRLVAGGIDVILLTGGTGITSRDVTVDTVSAMLDKILPGFGELFRMLSWKEIGPASMLSRATAGTIGRTLVFCLPGSTNAVRLALESLILPELRHLVRELRR